MTRIARGSLSTRQRIERSVNIDDRGCWRWQLRLDRHGYGRITVSGAVSLAHRIAFAEWVGPVPDGLELDHLCRVRDCVNPSHLEPVTGAENNRRRQEHSPSGAWSRAKTHCPRGHAYDEANTYVDRRGFRNCRACSRGPAHLRYGRDAVTS